MIRNTTLPQRVRAQAQLQLSQMHPYTRPTQIKNRCVASGTARSIIRDFRINRVSQVLWKLDPRPSGDWIVVNGVLCSSINSVCRLSLVTYLVSRRQAGRSVPFYSRHGFISLYRFCTMAFCSTFEVEACIVFHTIRFVPYFLSNLLS